MNTLEGIAGFLALAALTPGPNNLIVMRKATSSGLIGVLPAIAGVTCGGIALLAVVSAGAGSLFAAEPRLRLAIALGGCICLAWLAIDMMRSRHVHEDTDAPIARGTLGTGFLGLFVLQFFNPKGWLMLLTAVSALATVSASRTFAIVAALFIPVSLTGLLLWALFGTSLAVWFTRGKARIWLDRTAGGLLLGMAVFLLFAI